MSISNNAHRIYLGAAAISGAWAVFGYFRHWPVVYLLGEVGFAVLLVVISLVLRERDQNAIQEEQRKTARSIYRQPKRSRQRVNLPRALESRAAREESGAGRER